MVGGGLAPDPPPPPPLNFNLTFWTYLNQKCRKFYEMDKSTKKNFFHCLAYLDSQNFLSKFELVVVGGGVSKITPEPKMQEIS